MNIIPTGKRLYVEFDKVEEKLLESGIYISEKHSELTRLATILAVGERVEQDIFHIGDRVMVPYIAGYNIYFPDTGIISETHRIVSQENILCKIEE